MDWKTILIIFFFSIRCIFTQVITQEMEQLEVRLIQKKRKKKDLVTVLFMNNYLNFRSIFMGLRIFHFWATNFSYSCPSLHPNLHVCCTWIRKSLHQIGCDPRESWSSHHHTFGNCYSILWSKKCFASCFLCKFCRHLDAHMHDICFLVNGRVQCC